MISFSILQSRHVLILYIHGSQLRSVHPSLLPLFIVGKSKHRLVLFAEKSKYHLDRLRFKIRVLMFTGHRSNTSRSMRARLPSRMHIDTLAVDVTCTVRFTVQ